MALTKSDEASDTTVPLSALYKALPGVFDEMLGSTGKPGTAWAPVADWLTRTPAESQTATARKIEQLVYEHFYDPQRERLAWGLDNIPLLIDPATWAFLEKAAIQRAVLYSHLLKDLYGDQAVFADRLIPSTLIHSDQSFLRPLHGIPDAKPRLTFLALDFARDNAGEWRIIDTHTETPAGHGFALANRMVTAEVAGNLLQKTNTRRIGPFYHELIDHLYELAGGDDPLIVVLAPGAAQSSFAGHAYMARYMNLRRVQGSDLRVVGNRVYLKTIDGLQKIDLVVRAIEGHRADPLELQPDAFDGSVGLVEACRHNPDILVNGLGTAVVENRGLSGYLYGLARHFLDEELIVGDAPRFWLGDPDARGQVLSDIESYVFHSSQEGTGNPGEAAAGRTALALSDAERADLEAEIRFSGEMLVAEQPMGFATAPAWTPKGLRPEHYAVRIYVCAIGDKFEVMPGGLALSVDDGATVALTSKRAHSRDVWVVADTAQQPYIPLRRLASDGSTIHRKTQPLQSSVADNLFWLGRYVERADGTLRIIRQTLHHSADDIYSSAAYPHALAVLKAALNPQMSNDMESIGGFVSDPEALWRVLRELCTDIRKTQGLPYAFKRIRDVAIQCRSQLSEDGWRVLSGLNVNGLSSHFTPEMPAGYGDPKYPSVGTLNIIQESDALVIRLAAFNGMANENMTRNDGWLFLNLGRHLERTYQLAALLNSLFVQSESSELEGEDMIFALRAADSFITFRSRYHFAPELALVLDLLMIDETNPRALAFQLAEISENIGQLPKAADDAVRAPDQRLALELLTKVRLAKVEELAKPAESGKREALGALLGELIRELPHLSKLISRQYFSLLDEQPRRL